MTWIAAKARADLLKHCHTGIIAGRLKMLPPEAEDRGHGGTTDFAWFIMSREACQWHASGPRLMRRLDGAFSVRGGRYWRRSTSVAQKEVCDGR